MPLGILIDFSKAFDCVSQVLLKKLYYCDTRDKQLDLFRGYLTGRTQYVSISLKDFEYLSSMPPIVGFHKEACWFHYFLRYTSTICPPFFCITPS